MLLKKQQCSKVSGLKAAKNLFLCSFLFFFGTEELDEALIQTQTANLIKISLGESGSLFLKNHKYELKIGGNSTNNKTECLW